VKGTSLAVNLNQVWESNIRRGSPVSGSLLFKNDDNRPAWVSALLRNFGTSVEWEDASREGREKVGMSFRGKRVCQLLAVAGVA
jgi:hypothetical protein